MKVIMVTSAYYYSLTALVLLLFQVGSVTCTPVRDLSLSNLEDSHCDSPNLRLDDDLDGVVLLLNGKKLSEWRTPKINWWGNNYKGDTSQHVMHGVTKTWVSVLVGMLYRDGFLDWATEHPDKLTLGDIFSDEEVWNDVRDIPYIFHGGSKVEELKAITLGSLMSMRTGYSETMLGFPLDNNLVRDLEGLVAWWHPLYRAGMIESQTCFKCGDYLANTYIVHYIIKEKTKTSSNPDGWDPLDYARQTAATLPNGNVGLFEALGMEEGSYTWDRDTDGMVRDGLWLDLEDMAKFGQLLLQGGKTSIDGRLRTIVPAAYLEEMTMTQSRMTGSMMPHGWHIWNWGADDDGDSGFCAEGLGWQSICVFPKDNMVLAIQARTFWSLDAFSSNIDIRKAAVATIRNGISCSPTPAPSQSNFITNPGTMPPTVSLPNDNTAGNDEIVGNDCVSNNDKAQEAGESNLYFGEKLEGTNIPVGLVITLALALSMVAVLVVLFCCYRRQEKKEDNLRSSSAEVLTKGIPSSAFDEANKLHDVYLSDSDDDTQDSDDEGTRYADAIMVDMGNGSNSRTEYL